MDGLTIVEIAAELGISPAAAKKRLQSAGLSPTAYAGQCGIYSPSALDAIRDSRGPGRPPKAPSPKK